MSYFTYCRDVKDFVNSLSVSGLINKNAFSLLNAATKGQDPDQPRDTNRGRCSLRYSLQRATTGSAVAGNRIKYYFSYVTRTWSMDF